MKNLTPIILLLLTGCASAGFVSKSYNPKGGVVRYDNALLRSIQSRKLAFEMIQNYCGNGYRLTRESAIEKNVGYNLTGDQATPMQAYFVDLNFICK